MLGEWPQYRGPRGDGVAGADAPLRWSDTENIKWKIQLPGKGNSSPIVWGEMLFLTTAIPTGKTPPASAAPASGRRFPAVPLEEHRFVVLAVDRNTGKTLWERTAAVATPHEGYHHRYGSFASNSPVTDGERLIAFFGSRGVYCYDLAGNLLWKRDFGVKMRMRNAFGEGVAPVLAGDTLLLNFDQEAGSFLVALDKRTGEERWRKPRDEVSSWAPPVVVDYGGRSQAVVAATKRVRSYDLATGELIWECAGLGTNVIPAPVVHDGVVVVMSGHRDPNLLAIRLGERGDLTGTGAILWTNQRGNSYTPSPVLHDGKLYMVTDRGLVSCFDVKTGEAHYHQQRLPQPYTFKASPVAAGGKLYLASEEGDVIVLRLSPRYEVLASNTLTDQMFIATPAIAGGEIYLRSTTALYCISGR